MKSKFLTYLVLASAIAFVNCDDSSSSTEAVPGQSEVTDLGADTPVIPGNDVPVNPGDTPVIVDPSNPGNLPADPSVTNPDNPGIDVPVDTSDTPVEPGVPENPGDTNPGTPTGPKEPEASSSSIAPASSFSSSVTPPPSSSSSAIPPSSSSVAPPPSSSSVVSSSSIAAESQLKFGWPKGNAPVPTRGCGKAIPNGVPKSGSWNFKWSQGQRTVRIDVPDNYDNNKPYRLVFGMHCMGGWAGGVQQEGYYGLKPLDTQKTTIFIAPEGNGNQAPWGQGDYLLFDELLAFMQSNYCIDSSRVFSTGFSYGSMFSNGLSWNHQDVLRGVAVYETADVNIWLPQKKSLPIAWMGVLGLQDNLCTPAMGRSSRDRILKDNSAEGKDATKEKAQEYGGSGPHVCYNYKDVDENFPVRWCTQNGGHIWDHKDPGQQKSWVPNETWDFFTQL